MFIGTVSLEQDSFGPKRNVVVALPALNGMALSVCFPSEQREREIQAWTVDQSNPIFWKQLELDSF